MLRLKLDKKTVKWMDDYIRDGFAVSRSEVIRHAILYWVWTHYGPGGLAKLRAKFRNQGHKTGR